MDKISVCGIDCSVSCVECNKDELLKDNPCKGCNAEEGKVFWLKFMNLETCPIYSCVKEKQLKHCGECVELPCATYFSLKDPSITNEQNQEGINARVALLKTLIN